MGTHRSDIFVSPRSDCERDSRRSLTTVGLACVAMVVAAAGIIPAQRLLAQATQQQATTPAANAQTQQPPATLADVTERQGPFSIDGQQYTLMYHEKALRKEPTVKTLAVLEILDAAGRVVRQERFPYSFADGRFSPARTASASLLMGRGGAALVIRFLEQAAAASEAQGQPAKESWQVLGVVNGQLSPFGAVLPLGQGSNITVGGVVTGVMVKGGIAVVPLASTAEILEFRAWTGNFYAFVPVRMDWPHGKWGEGAQCYALANGTLQARGCLMRVEAHRVVTPDGAGTGVVRLFATTEADTYNSQSVEVHADSNVEFLGVLAIVHWQAIGDRVECDFSDEWLRTRIDGQEGWVHGQEAFRALGLPRQSPE